MPTVISKKEVRKWMLERNISTMRDLADRASLAEATLYNALDREGWHSRTLDAIADALDVNSLCLLEDEADRRWEELFADPRSERVLGEMAEKARNTPKEELREGW